MRRTATSIIIAVSLAACGSKGSPSSPSTGNSGSSAFNFSPGTLKLSVPPIDQSAIRWITPLGNLNPPGHPVPTDHIYFYFANPDAGESPEAKRTDFFAPGDGTVLTVLGGVGAESKIYVRQTSTFSYYLDHLILNTALSQGSKITAGQKLGTSGTAYAVDLGVVNDSLTLNFIIPSHYISDTLHADAPLKYFDEPLRSQLYARVQRLGSDLDGKIDFDTAGRLSGNWFAGTTAVISFAYDTYNPSRIVIATGVGTLIGTFSIAPGEPAPADVSPDSGKVVYTLTKTITGPPKGGTESPSGYMLVQMTDATHIRMQTFPLGTVPTDFTSGAGIFSR